MSLNNAVVNSFLQNDADLLSALKTKAMKKLVKHLTPDEQYAFIERVVDSLPSATITSSMVTFNTHGDQGLFVEATYTPKHGDGDIRSHNDLENMPRDLYHPNNPKKEIGYKLLSYYLTLRGLYFSLRQALKDIKRINGKSSKHDKHAKALLGRVCWFVYLAMVECTLIEDEQEAISVYLSAGIDKNLDTEVVNMFDGLVDGSTQAIELAKAMVGEHMYLIHISMFHDTDIPFITVRNSDIEMDLDNVNDGYQAKMDKFIQHYREYLSMHGVEDVDDKIKRVICGMRLAYAVVKTLRYPSPDKSEIVKRYRKELTDWKVKAVRIYNIVNKF